MYQRYYLGKDSIRNLINEVEYYRPNSVFLVRGKKSYESCGAQSVINNALVSLNLNVVEFWDFETNPKMEDLQKGLKLLTANHCNIILAIGGGSVLDMAKLIRFFNSYKGEITDSVFEQQNEVLPLIAIPTTAGTGSEATHFAVLYKDQVKYSIAHEAILPDVAIVDPVFTYNNSSYLSATTGFDALAQALEAFWNLNSTTESDLYATKAISLLWHNLPLLIHTSEDKIRDEVAEGAFWVGRAINITKTTAPHAFSYPLTTFYQVPHGHAVAIVFPWIMQLNLNYMLQNNPESYNKIVLLNKEIGMFNRIDKETGMKMKIYIDNLNLKNHLIGQVDLNLITKYVDPVRLKNNPCLISTKMVREIYQNIFN